MTENLSTLEAKVSGDRQCRLKTQNSCQEYEARFQSAFDYAAIGMALVGLDGSWLQVNRSLCNILGYSEPELRALTFQDITHPEDLEADLHYVQQLLAGEIHTYQMEKRYFHKQGHQVWALLSVSLVREPSGQPLYFISQIQDISQRKQMESHLELQSLIAKNIAEGICLLRAADGIMVYTNPKFERMFGYEPGELIGQHVTCLNYDNGEIRGKDVAAYLIEQIHRYGEFTYEVHNVKKDGTPFWCRATTSVFEHPDYGTVYVAVQADVTAEKQAQASVRLLQNLTLAISKAEDFNTALSLILQEVSEAHGWAYGEAWIPSLDDDVLICSPAFYSDLSPRVSSPLDRFRRVSETFTFPHNIGLPGRVWASQQPEWRIDVSQEPATDFLRQSIAAECGIRAGLGIPIVAHGDVLAVLVFFKREAAQVDQYLMANLTAAAAQLSLVIQRKQAEDALFNEKELAQVTLQSIGDAVVTTDALGYIQYLNPVAQTLMGWEQSEVQNRPLSEVFHLIDGTTREPVPNPVEQALVHECVVGLDADTVLINRDGCEIAIDDSAAPIRSRNDEVIGAVMVFQDVSEARSLSQQLTWQASHDTLTQLINRREFERRLDTAIDKAKRQHQSHVLCFLDLDRFKIVNDTCGHGAGDELLRQVSDLLQTQVRKTDTLARIGGDEFGLILHQCSLEQAFRVVDTLQEQVQGFRFVWEDKSFTIGASMGLVVIDADCESSEIAMGQADVACYAAKRRGLNRMHIYKPDDDDLMQQKGQMQWVNRLTDALAENRFCLYYQPIISLADAEVNGEHYEVLLRLRDEAGNLIPPGAFIPAAERYNLMHRIDRWVIQTLFASQSAYYQTVWNRCQDEGRPCHHLYTVNLSGASLNDDQFIDFLHQQFARYQVPPQLICFEVTETVAISNLGKAARFMKELQALGCRFALDDFGSGMSSFGYLKNLPVDYIKIDGSFVKGMVDNPIDATVVEAIHRVGQAMGLQTIAEFVENEDILEKLEALGVNYAQGYGIAKPSLLTSNEANHELSSPSLRV